MNAGGIRTAIHCGLDCEFRPPILPKIWHENPYPKSTPNVDIGHLSRVPVLGVANKTSYEGTDGEFEFGCTCSGILVSMAASSNLTARAGYTYIMAARAVAAAVSAAVATAAQRDSGCGAVAGGEGGAAGGGGGDVGGAANVCVWAG